jgi:3-deoxy-7-phosphoheptulonate synthase
VTPLALAAVAAGADGLLVEVHAAPQLALSDGEQSLTPEAFADMMRRVEAVARAVGRPLAQPSAPPAVRAATVPTTRRQEHSLEDVCVA